MRIIGLLAAIALSTISSLSFAGEEHVVSQKNKAFVPSELEIRAGDTVVFVNEDAFRHNVYSETPGHEFGIAKQKPGDSDSVVFDTPGEVEIRCVIHPQMELTIRVTE